MYVIIAGGGLIGKGLTKRLAQQKHDVVVIDFNAEVCEEIYARYGAVAINGNSTDLATLESAGIARCNVAVATMNDDSDNLAFALLAKHFNVSQIIVKMNDPKYENIYQTVGVKNISRGTELLVDQIMLNIEAPELRTAISMNNIEIAIFIIPEHAKCSGQPVSTTVNQKGFPREVIFTCVADEATGLFRIPRGDTILHEGDRVFLCGSMNDIKTAVKFLS